MKYRGQQSSSRENKVFVSHEKKKKKNFKCHHCDEVGHIKKYCKKYHEELAAKKKEKSHNTRANQSDSDEEYVGLLACHALASACDPSVKSNSWIVDSGATCHMTNDYSIFVSYEEIKDPIPVMLGDDTPLEAIGRGDISVRMKLNNDKCRVLTLKNVLHVPKLAYNLLSVSTATKAGKKTIFSENTCEIIDAKGKLVATGKRNGKLYYLDCDPNVSVANIAKSDVNTWHRRFGHLSIPNLKYLAKEKLVENLDFKSSEDQFFCEPCAMSKIHRFKFPKNTNKKLCQKPLELVHSDVCGKINTPSLGGSE